MHVKKRIVRDGGFEKKERSDAGYRRGGNVSVAVPGGGQFQEMTCLSGTRSTRLITGERADFKLNRQTIE